MKRNSRISGLKGSLPALTSESDGVGGGEGGDKREKG